MMHCLSVHNCVSHCNMSFSFCCFGGKPNSEHTFFLKLRKSRTNLSPTLEKAKSFGSKLFNKKSKKNIIKRNS